MYIRSRSIEKNEIDKCRRSIGVDQTVRRDNFKISYYAEQNTRYQSLSIELGTVKKSNVYVDK